jgi:hypothetical protein
MIVDSARPTRRFRTAIPSRWPRRVVRKRSASGAASANVRCSDIHFAMLVTVASVERQRRMAPTRAQFESESEAPRAGDWCPRFINSQKLPDRHNMTPRVRHCLECPKCLTRYLIASSPYGNGSYVIPTVPYLSEELTLYCACGKPAVPSRWRWSELITCKVSRAAYQRGYGTSEEIVLVRIHPRNAQPMSQENASIGNLS